jgi:hypothetical protein
VRKADYDLSLLVAGAIDARPRRCWRNAALSVLLLGITTYIEGWIVVPQQRRIVLLEHGWSVTHEGHIVDPTIVLTEPEEQPVFYFPGYMLHAHSLPARLAGQTLPLVCHSRYGADGMRNPRYRKAYRRAYTRAWQLARANNLSSTAILVNKRDPQVGVTYIVQ